MALFYRAQVVPLLGTTGKTPSMQNQEGHVKDQGSGLFHKQDCLFPCGSQQSLNKTCCPTISFHVPLFIISVCLGSRLSFSPWALQEVIQQSLLGVRGGAGILSGRSGFLPSQFTCNTAEVVEAQCWNSLHLGHSLWAFKIRRAILSSMAMCPFSSPSLRSNFHNSLTLPSQGP